MTLQPGYRLGVYEILDTLGAGGMGVVYRARDRKLGRDVAIKVLPDDPAGDPGRVARFEREARMLAAVNHPTIAAIYGAEEDGSTRYIVMELVEGETLAQRLAGGPLPIADALRVGLPDRRGARVRAREGHHPPGPQAREHQDHARGQGQGPRLRARQDDEPPVRGRHVALADGRHGDVDAGRDRRHTGVHEPGAGARQGDRPAHRHLVVRLHPLSRCSRGGRAFTGETIPDALAAILDRSRTGTRCPRARRSECGTSSTRCLEKDAGRRAARRRRRAPRARGRRSSGCRCCGRRSAPLGRLPWKLLGAAALGAAVAIAAYLCAAHTFRRCSRRRERQLAVLPFRNLTGSTAR